MSRLIFSMLLSAEMKLPICLKSITSSSNFPLRVVFLVLRVFSLMSLVGCILRPTVSATFPTLSVFSWNPFGNAKEGQRRRRSLYVPLLTRSGGVVFGQLNVSSPVSSQALRFTDVCQPEVPYHRLGIRTCPHLALGSGKTCPCNVRATGCQNSFSRILLILV